MPTWIRNVFTGLALASMSAAVFANLVVPPKARITDLTATLSVQQLTLLDQTLATFEARKGVKIAVLIVPNTQPETPTQYWDRVKEKWSGGDGNKGVWLLLAKGQRQVLLKVGDELDGVLDRAKALRILDEELMPRLNTGDFYGGISLSIARIISVIDEGLSQQPKNAEPQTRSLPQLDLQSAATKGAIASLFGVLVGGVLFFLIKPRGRPTTPSQLGRLWMAWWAIAVCGTFVGKAYSGGYTVMQFLGVYVPPALFVLLCAYLVGWLYGRLFTFRTRLAIANQAADEGIYETAMKELEGPDRRTGVWAKALAEFEGDEAKAKAKYIQLRVQQMKAGVK